MNDEAGAPMNQRFEARFEDGSVKSGATDAEGKLHLEDCPSGDCDLLLLQDETSATTAAA